MGKGTTPASPNPVGSPLPGPYAYGAACCLKQAAE